MYVLNLLQKSTLTFGRGSTAHAPHAFISHTFYLDRSFHRLFRPYTTRSSMNGGDDRQGVSMRGGNYASCLLDFSAVKDTFSAAESSSESNSTTPPTVSHTFNEQSNILAFNIFAGNLSTDSTRYDPTSAIQSVSKAPRGFGLDNHEIDATSSKDVDILHYDDLSSYFPTCWNENMSFLSDSEPVR
jgi:hypothetical protein